MSTFIIAEAGSSHDNDLQKAYRLIEAAKECGADAVKFQWTSDALKMAQRRGFSEPGITHAYQSYLAKPERWLHDLKAHADKVGIEFMCTVYLIEDIATIAPLVKRWKISAFEAQWEEFLYAHQKQKGEIIISLNPGKDHTGDPFSDDELCERVKPLHCISEYPAPIEKLGLSRLWEEDYGLSDHTANVLTGAAAVAAGAKIVEAHIRLMDTDPKNPDYGHSLDAYLGNSFATYVRNIRTVERML